MYCHLLLDIESNPTGPEKKTLAVLAVKDKQEEQHTYEKQISHAKVIVTMKVSKINNM